MLSSPPPLRASKYPTFYTIFMKNAAGKEPMHQTSENPQEAKFAKFQFPDVG